MGWLVRLFQSTSNIFSSPSKLPSTRIHAHSFNVWYIHFRYLANNISEMQYANDIAISTQSSNLAQTEDVPILTQLVNTPWVGDSSPTRTKMRCPHSILKTKCNESLSFNMTVSLWSIVQTQNISELLWTEHSRSKKHLKELSEKAKTRKNGVLPPGL